jgi:gas vesicle protein
MRQENKTPEEGKSFRRGALIGAIIGGIMALWNAPQSGHKTRQQIGNIFRRVRGESVEESLDYGKLIAQQNRAERAGDDQR